MGIYNFEKAKNLILTVKDDISFYEKINELLGNNFFLEELREFKNFDDKTNKITLLNPDLEDNDDKIKVVDYTDKNVFVATSLTSEISPLEQIMNQVRVIDGVAKRNPNLIVSLNPYFYFARADGDSKELLNRYNSNQELSEKEMQKVIQRVNSTDDLQLYLKMLMVNGIDALVSFDMHNESDVITFAQQINEKYNLGKNMDKFVFNLDTLPVFVHHVKNNLFAYSDLKFDPKKIVISSTDEGSDETMRRAIKLFDEEIGYVSCKKIKEETDEGYKINIKVDDTNIDSLQGKYLIIFDDCTGSFKTISDTVKANTKKLGNPDYVIALISHPTIYNPQAFKNLRKGTINLVTTNTRPNIAYHAGRNYKNISTLDLTQYLYQVLDKCFGSGEIKNIGDVINLNSNTVLESLYQISASGKHTQKKLIKYNPQI